MNLYGYVSNDPANATDPSGEISVSDVEDPDETTESELRFTPRTAPPPGGPSRTSPRAPPIRPGTVPRPPGWGAPSPPPPPPRTSPVPGDPDVVPAGPPDFIIPGGHDTTSGPKRQQDPGAGRQGGSRSGGKPHNLPKGGSKKGDKHTKPRPGTKTKQRDKPDWHQR